MTLTEFAPAKVNLALHVTGQRDDGYHLLDSIVMFGPVADLLSFEPAAATSLEIRAPAPTGLANDENNLVLRAARQFAPEANARVTLEKNLPIAAGIGGGSSDAAAAIRGLLRLGPGRSTTDRLVELMPATVALGADVPVCLFAHSARMRGIGEQVDFLSLPPVYAVLANPGIKVSTPEIFALLANKSNPPIPNPLPHFDSAPAFIDWLADQRNDLMEPAMKLAPEIGDVLDELAGLPQARLARMSGSGATCFALFNRLEHAMSGAAHLTSRHPDWWVAGGTLGEDWTSPS